MWLEAEGPAGVGPAGVGPAGVGPAGVGPAGVGPAGVLPGWGYDGGSTTCCASLQHNHVAKSLHVYLKCLESIVVVKPIFIRCVSCRSVPCNSLFTSLSSAAACVSALLAQGQVTTVSGVCGQALNEQDTLSLLETASCCMSSRFSWLLGGLLLLGPVGVEVLPAQSGRA
jgi:hypothetical protein